MSQQTRADWTTAIRAETPEPPAVAQVAREFIDYYETTNRHGGGCSNCGGLPHTLDCFVKRFHDALSSSPQRPPQGWQPIETAPKDGTKILILNKFGEIELSHWYQVLHERYVPAEDGLFRRIDDVVNEGWNSNYPTHWMPLPEAPK